ncbi:MAG: hypothetical protein L3K13_04925 [Thermoplasmata archaeon]|nr:hypothetical protein [Thermoplasmata archaeon]
MGRSERRTAEARRGTPTEPFDSQEQRGLREQRGREELFDVRREAGVPFVAFQVTNPVRSTRYTVYWPTFPAPAPISCDCADFAHRGLGVCKHIEAVRLWTQEHAGEFEASAPSPDGKLAGNLWREIDRRSSALRAIPPVRASSLRWAEPVLLNFGG